MSFFLGVSQFPAASYLNGGTGSAARRYRLGLTQGSVNGPRIAAAVAGMSPGDFGAVWADSADEIFQVRQATDGSSANILDWTPHNVWHQATEQVLHGGRRGTIKLIAYSDLTGDWREMPTPADLGRNVSTTVHFYGPIAQDDAGYVYYGTTESISQTWRFDPAEVDPETAWTRLADTGSFSQLGSSFAWDSSANSGAGGLLKYVQSQTLLLLNAAGTSWSTVATSLGHAQHALLCYHPSHSRSLLIGGSSSLTRASLVTAAGGVTLATDCPADIHGMSPAGWVVPHPSGCWLVRSGADLHVYAAWPNEAYTDLTWQDLGAAPDAALTNPTAALDTTHGAVLITAQSGLYAWTLPDVSAPGSVISCSPGSASAAGSSAQIILLHILAGVPGDAVAAGAGATVIAGSAINTQPASATAAGATASVILATHIGAEPGVSVAAGATASVISGAAIAAEPGAAVAAGATATVIRSTLVMADPGAAVASGAVASIGSGLLVSAQPAVATAAGAVAQVLMGSAIPATVGAAVADGAVAQISLGRIVNAVPGNAAAAGADASVLRLLLVGGAPGVAVANGAAAAVVASAVINTAPGAATAAGATAFIYTGVQQRPSADRTYLLPAENRVLRLPAEDRIYRLRT